MNCLLYILVLVIVSEQQGNLLKSLFSSNNNKVAIQPISNKIPTISSIYSSQPSIASMQPKIPQIQTTVPTIPTMQSAQSIQSALPTIQQSPTIQYTHKTTAHTSPLSTNVYQ